MRKWKFKIFSLRAVSLALMLVCQVSFAEFGGARISDLLQGRAVFGRNGKLVDVAGNFKGIDGFFRIKSRVANVANAGKVNGNGTLNVVEQTPDLSVQGLQLLNDGSLVGFGGVNRGNLNGVDRKTKNEVMQILARDKDSSRDIRVIRFIARETQNPGVRTGQFEFDLESAIGNPESLGPECQGGQPQLVACMRQALNETFYFLRNNRPGPINMKIGMKNGRMTAIVNTNGVLNLRQRLLLAQSSPSSRCTGNLDFSEVIAGVYSADIYQQMKGIDGLNRKNLLDLAGCDKELFDSFKSNYLVGKGESGVVEKESWRIIKKSRARNLVGGTCSESFDFTSKKTNKNAVDPRVCGTRCVANGHEGFTPGVNGVMIAWASDGNDNILRGVPSDVVSTEVAGTMMSCAKCHGIEAGYCNLFGGKRGTSGEYYKNHLGEVPNTPLAFRIRNNFGQNVTPTERDFFDSNANLNAKNNPSCQNFRRRAERLGMRIRDKKTGQIISVASRIFAAQDQDIKPPTLAKTLGISEAGLAAMGIKDPVRPAILAQEKCNIIARAKAGGFNKIASQPRPNPTSGPTGNGTGRSLTDVNHRQ